MKLSKSLLQAILVGITLGGATASCTKSEEPADHNCTTTCGENCPEKNNPEVLDPGNCPACGMG